MTINIAVCLRQKGESAEVGGRERRGRVKMVEKVL